MVHKKLNVKSKNRGLIKIMNLNGDTSNMQALFADPNIKNKSLSNPLAARYYFKHAAINGYYWDIKLHLAIGVIDVGLDDNYALRVSVEKDHTENIILLLGSDKVNPMAMNNYAVKNCIQYGKVEILKLLLKDKRVIITDGEINYANKFNNNEIITLLINR